MSRFFKRNKKSDNITTDNVALNSLMHLKDDVKQRVREANGDSPEATNCCVKLFSCLKKVNDSIPKNYKAIMNWLTEIATIQAIDGYNEKVLVSALRASLSFLSQDTTNSELSALLLKELIEEIASQNKIDLDLEPDYDLLQQYCDEKSITIPQDIVNIMNKQNLTNAA
jgi:hypothetical protein